MGSMLGGLLAEAGAEVTLVGRARHVEAIERGGLRLNGVGGERTIRLKATEKLGYPVGLAIFAVKTQDLGAACQEVAPMVGRGPVVTLQNGVRADDIAAEVFGRDQICGCTAFSMASFLQPGEVSIHVRGWLTIGAPFEARPGLIGEVRRMLVKALPVVVAEDIRAVRWTKLIGNLNNALPAATGLPLQEVYFNPSTARLPLRLMREGLSVIAAAGLHTDSSPQALAMRLAASLPEPLPLAIFRLVARTPLGSLPMLGSTWQSIKRGSATEIDFLNGEVIRLGKKVGIPTPYNLRAVELVREVEKTGEFFPLKSLWPR